MAYDKKERKDSSASCPTVHRGRGLQSSVQESTFGRELATNDAES